MKNNLNLFLNLLDKTNLEYRNHALNNLLINLLEILQTADLLNWTVTESIDIVDDLSNYSAERFNQEFRFWNNVNEVQKEFKILYRKNYNYYFILQMVTCENFFDELLDLIYEKLNGHEIIFRGTDYFLGNKEICKRWRKKDGSFESISLKRTVPDRLWFFHEVFGSRCPKTNQQKKEIYETDFKFYSELRNFLLHENGMIKCHDYLRIYSTIEPSIITSDNRILLNQIFFHTSIKNLFNICLEINDLSLKRIL